MAEIVDYRIEKTLDELHLLVEFGVFTENEAKEVVSRRRDFEYSLRRKTSVKLELLKYIRFEVNLLESIEKYKKAKLGEYYQSKKANQDEENKAVDKLEEIEQRILLLQAKKLNDIIRSRCAHISSLFRKLTYKYQFDQKLWLAYIEFAKRRKWNTRVSALYWRLLRVASQNEDLWLQAARHETDTNKTYDIARGLYLKALRHHPKSPKIWSQYFKMELRFMSVVDQRARIIFKVTSNPDNQKSENQLDEEAEEEEGEEEVEPQDQEDIWADANNGNQDNEGDHIPKVKPVDETDAIISGRLPKVIYDHATVALDTKENFERFILSIMKSIYKFNDDKAQGLKIIKDYILKDLQNKNLGADERVPESLLDACQDSSALQKFFDDKFTKSTKKQRTHNPSNLDMLYECYETKGIEDTRKLFVTLDKSVKNQTLSLYVGMIQVETWHMKDDKSQEQLNRIRNIFDKSLSKFGKTKPKLWYEYLQFEQTHQKDLGDFERINQLYTRAMSTLEPSKAAKVTEKYTLMRLNSQSVDVEYSDYSDLED